MLNSRTPQHDLRTPIPRRADLRAAVSPRHHAMLSAHLTVRDRWIARMVAEHRVLTSTQITEIAFPSRRAANLRLHQLFRWRVLDRFQPYIGRGRAPMFYVLDAAGAHMLAYEDGMDPAALRFRPERSLGISHSHRLAHLHGVNSFFTPFIHHARSNPAAHLDAWWPETRCTRHFGDLVRPDAYGRWREDRRGIEWFLEWDTGHYQLARLAAKLHDYARLTSATKIVTPVLMCFASPRREAHARSILAAALRDLPRPDEVPVATSNAVLIDQQHTAAAAVWLPIDGHVPGRLRLSELASAWPHLAPPTGAASDDAESGDPVRLRPPPAMPPWDQTAELTWRKQPTDPR
ncbi:MULTISPECIES: replication-relaxation family protein [Amycolatopsis]|uniref:Replication-relaxation n=1 Tax=Amycolatopsis dongchuanensis TaxID=1070866 RepID=A0ABP9PVL0_9PSEU